MNRFINRACALIVTTAILLTSASCAKSVAEVTLPVHTFEHQLVSFNEINYTEYTYDEIVSKYETFVSDFKAATTPNEQAAVMFAEDDFTRELFMTSSVLMIKYNKDQTNVLAREKYLAYSDMIAEISDIAMPFARLIAESEFRGALALRFGEEYFYNLDELLAAYNPAISAIAQQIAHYVDEYGQIRGDIGVTYKNQTYDIYDVYDYFNIDYDFAVILLNEFWKQNNDLCADIFISLIELRQEQARLAGFDNYYDYFYSDKNILGYGKDETFAVDRYVKEYISPIYIEIKQNYAKELGLDVLPFEYDLSQMNYLSREVKPELLDDENKYYEIILDTIESISGEAGAIVKSLDSLSLIDMKPAKNKLPGAYTTIIRGINQPFVFSDALDANVAFHELGHAVNMYETANLAEVLSQEIFDTAHLEIPSSTMEVLSMKYFDDIYVSSESAKRAWTFDMLEEIVDTAMFDELQRYIYTTENITMEMINTEYARLRDEYKGATDYGPFTSLNDGFGWIYDSHAFADPFYSVQYGVATIVSLEFYELSLADYDAAVDKYMKFCKLGYTYNIVEALSECGLKNVFSEQTVKDAGGTLRGILMG